MNKKSIATALVCYVVWGILAAYWNLLSGIDSMFILCCRIVFSLVLMVLLLFFTTLHSIDLDSNRLNSDRTLFNDKVLSELE